MSHLLKLSATAKSPSEISIGAKVAPSIGSQRRSIVVVVSGIVVITIGAADVVVVVVVETASSSPPPQAAANSNNATPAKHNLCDRFFICTKNSANHSLNNKVNTAAQSRYLFWVNSRKERDTKLVFA